MRGALFGFLKTVLWLCHLKEFGILDPHQILYKFAIYAFEVKHEQKYECGFVSFNEVPLHCQIAFMVNLDADGGAGKVIFEKNCLLKSFLGCHYFSFKKDHSLRLNSSTSGYFHWFHHKLPYSFDYNSHSISVRIRLIFAIFRRKKKYNTHIVFEGIE